MDKLGQFVTLRSKCLTFNTLLGMALTGKVVSYKKGFGAMPADLFHAPFPVARHGVSVADNIAALDKLFKADVDPARVAAIPLWAGATQYPRATLLLPRFGQHSYSAPRTPFISGVRQIVVFGLPYFPVRSGVLGTSILLIAPINFETILYRSLTVFLQIPLINRGNIAAVRFWRCQRPIIDSSFFSNRMEKGIIRQEVRQLGSQSSRIVISLIVATSRLSTLPI